MIASNFATVIAVTAFFVITSTESLEGQDGKNNDVKISPEESGNYGELNEVGSTLMNYGIGWQDSVPGVPGRDYPNLRRIPETSFSCTEKTPGGYYADVETKCQVFHVCSTGNIKSSFLCPSGSIFNQKHLVCDWWYDFDCNNAPDLYALNEILNNPEDNVEQVTEQEEKNPNNQGEQYYNGNSLSTSKDKGYAVSKNSDLSLASTGDARNSQYRHNSVSDTKDEEVNEKTFENLRLVETSTRFPSNTKGRINDDVRNTSPANYVQSTHDSSYVANYRSSSSNSVEQSRHNFVENHKSNFHYGSQDATTSSGYEQDKTSDLNTRQANSTYHQQKTDDKQYGYGKDENITPEQYNYHETVTQVIDYSVQPHEVQPYSTLMPYNSVYPYNGGSYSTSRPEVYVPNQGQISSKTYPPNVSPYSTIRPESQIFSKAETKNILQSNSINSYSTVSPQYSTLRKDGHFPSSTTKQPNQVSQNSKTDNKDNRLNILPRGFIKTEFTNKLQKSSDRQPDIAKYSGSFVNDGLVTHDFLKYNGYQNINYDSGSYDTDVEGAPKEFQFEEEEELKKLPKTSALTPNARRNPAEVDVDRKRQWEVDSADLKRNGFDGDVNSRIDLSTSDSPSFRNSQNRVFGHQKYSQAEFEDYSDSRNSERFERRTLGTRPTGGLTKGLGNGFPGANRELAGSIAIAGKIMMREEDFLKMEEERREYLPPFGKKSSSE